MKTCECQAVCADDAVYCAACGRRLAETVNAVTAPPPVESVVPITNAVSPKRIPVIVASFVAIVLVVAIGLTYVLRNVHIDISSNNLVSVQLPLNVCKTSVGDASEVPAILPADVRVKIARGASTQLAFYSDNEGLIEVLAPTGWKCSAGIGADGSSSLYVSPLGLNSDGPSTESVSASQTSACVGCRESLACPLFVSAAKDYLRSYLQACPTTRPPAELVTKINRHVVEFTDPPGVNGDGSPSGGVYPARGVMTYFDDPSSDGSWTETCLLPTPDRSVCTAIVGNFVTRYGAR